MPRYRRVAYVGSGRPRWMGCLGTLVLLAVIVGAFLAIRAFSRPRRPPRQPTLDRWEVREPGQKAPPSPAAGPERSEPTVPPVEAARPSAEEAPTRSVEEALAAARACAAAGDQGCCIRELEGTERTIQVLNTLLTCYERAGRTAEACELSRRHPECRACQAFAATSCAEGEG